MKRGNNVEQEGAQEVEAGITGRLNNLAEAGKGRIQGFSQDLQRRAAIAIMENAGRLDVETRLPVSFAMLDAWKNPSSIRGNTRVLLASLMKRVLKKAA